MRKKIDDRIKALIERGIKLNERTMFVVVGDRGRDQIANIHHFYTKLNPGKKLNILWCYNKELGFSSKANKKIRKIKNQQNKGLYEVNEENAFDLFISSSEIKYNYYNESHRILGNTFGMLILQDFEAITPNLLCRTIETVSGGGIVVMLFNTMASLKQLYTISMDVHSRYRTESHKNIEPRFNERFILSLANNKNCIVMDDELNILPISSHINDIKAISNEDIVDIHSENVYTTESEKELNNLKNSLKDKAPIGNLVAQCRTLDQAKCVMAMVESISEKITKTTVSITASRGRGKSSAMGLAISSAIVYGFSNIFVTAPSPENLKTFFEFIVKGLLALNYREHLDFQVQESSDPEFKNMIIRVIIFRDHKQSISYVKPNDYSIINSAEIVCIDEAAAIPLHVVRRLIAPCLNFLASTVQGYEGTGRSLSLKLIKQLREQTFSSGDNNSKNNQSISNSRNLKEIKLEKAIRYADNDPIELWLNNLLCLDATDVERIFDGFPHPKDCDLYLVNRDTLFSYNKGSELFLKKIMSLFVSSHYKNSPNDLQLLSDAPAHSIFVLTKTIDKESSKGIPEIYAAIQICEEGGIGKDIVMNNSKRGYKPSGDLIPWTVAENYQDNEFPNMIGIRIVRISTHPDALRMGYGSRALQILSQFYEGKIVNLNEVNCNSNDTENKSSINNANLQTELLKPKKKLKPLLSCLSDVKPSFVHWIGTAFGLTKELFNFWKKNDFHPVYLKLSENDITGEHSCIMMKPLRDDDITYQNQVKSQERWLLPFVNDFKKRFMSLLGYDFRDLSIKLALSLVDAQMTATTKMDDEENDENENEKTSNINIIKTKEKLDMIISKYDYNRLDKYSKNQIKYQLILDLVPEIAKSYFLKRFNFNLSYSQAAILLGLGLQYKTLEALQEELNIPLNQILAMFNKSIKKVTNYIKGIYEKDFEKDSKLIDKVKLPCNQISSTLKDDVAEEEQKTLAKNQIEKSNFIKENINLLGGSKKRSREEHSELDDELKSSMKIDKNNGKA